MTQTQQVGTHATTVAVDPQGYTTVTFHQTSIVRFNEREIILNSGGFKTVTTKRRMNQASQQYALGFHVVQKYYKWYVDFAGQRSPFPGQTLTLTRNGHEA